MTGLPPALFPGSESMNEPLITGGDGDREEVEMKATGRRSFCRVEDSQCRTDHFGGNENSSSRTGGATGSQLDNISVISSDFLNGTNSHHGSIRKAKWKEAALYVHEGETDAKIFHHPEGYWSRRAYKTLHHQAYYITHLIIAIVLLLLAVVESPITLKGKHPIHQQNTTYLSLTTVLEIILLSFFFLDIFLKFIWFGPKQFFTHVRTIFISIVLLVMVVEAIVVLIRQDSHPRLTRALRPIVLIDNHYLHSVRRVMRQIFLCIKPITDVLLLILFFVVFFSLLGYYIFSEVDPSFYSSFWKSFVSLFITMTTSNNPDVMLETYFEKNWSPLFFLVYLAITFYYLMNVLLAVVYGSFEEEEKKKFRKLFKHKLYSLDKAYEVLSSEEEDSSGICFYDFLMFMRYYRPMISEWQVMCIFKALHSDAQQQNQYLSKEEFRRLYEVTGLNWKPQRTNKDIISQSPFRVVIKIHKIFHVVKSKPFNIIINLIVLTNLLFLIIYTIVTSDSSSERFSVLERTPVVAVSYLFISVYVTEIILRIIGLGPYDYFRKKRNICDFTIIMISFICLILETKVPSLAYLAAVRPFKLLRVLRLKQRFRDIGSTTKLLLPRLANIAILLLVIYYFFAIIGIETLGGKVVKGCCNNSWYSVGSSYSGIYTLNTNDNIPPSSDVYYILNFNNILTSYVTLFVLMVVNNWYIIMEGFASEVEAGWLVRVYFISFFIVMLVILQVVISFIVDEFKFKVLDTAKKRVCPQHGKPFEHCHCKRYRKKVVEITLQPSDIEVLETVKMPNYRRNLSYYIRKFRQIKLSRDTQMNFIGRRLKTKEDIKLKIFETEIEEWTNEYEETNKLNAHSKTETLSKKEAIMNKTKHYTRECFLYFIDWVIE